MASYSDRQIAYALLRLALGVNFFGHGLVRIVTGVQKFAEGVIKGFQHSPLPEALVTPIAYAIPFLELALGIALILGFLSRAAFICGALFMSLLTFGSTMKSDFNAAGGQLLYSVVFFLLLALHAENTLSVDARLGRRSPP
jgi:thiosulfate dehydrogenase (quinone) large subunit